MLLNIIKQFNWVDIFIVILLIRIFYISIRSGLAIEIFKVAGTVLAIFLSLHHYTNLADIIKLRLTSEKVPIEFLDFLCFVFLAFLGYLIVALLCKVFSRFIKIEAVPALNKWGGLTLGVVRGFLLSSIVIYVLSISGISYFKNSVIDSYFGKRLFKIAPVTYGKIWSGFVSKFVPKEKFNPSIQEVEKAFKK